METYIIAVDELPKVTPRVTLSTANISATQTGLCYRNNTTLTGTGGFSVSGTGGSSAVTLDGLRNDLLRFNATITNNATVQSFGNNAAHNNLSPYIVCYIWKRVS